MDIDFLEVTNVNRQSYFVNFTFSFVGRKIEEYIDCGTVKIQDEDNYYLVKPAAASYRYTVLRKNHRDTHRVTNKLNGKANIFVGGNDRSSFVKIQTKYELVMAELVETTQKNHFFKPKISSIGFKNYQSEQFTLDYGNIVECQVTGKLEKTLFNLVHNAK